MGKGDYIDLTLLAKKGFIKTPKIEKDNLKMNKEGYLEVVGNPSVPAESSSNVTQNTFSNNTSSASPFGSFFGDNSPVSSTGTSNDSTGNYYASSINEAPQSSPSLNGVDVNTMKIKIEDLEYKLDQFLQKLNLIEEKLGKSIN